MHLIFLPIFILWILAFAVKGQVKKLWPEELKDKETNFDFRKNKLLFMSAHDVNLANRFCTHALLLLGNGEYICGKIKEVVTTENLEQLYEININKFSQGNQTLFFPA